MFKKFTFSNRLSKEQEIDIVLKDILKVCRNITVKEFADLCLCDYMYETDEAIKELGLEKELIDQLLEDYVTQVLKNINQFEKYIDRLKSLSQKRSSGPLRESDYQELRDLAHKNLGVARNLRIKDAEKILKLIHKSDNIEHIELALKLLEACAIKLKPNCAYNTLNLIEIKNSF
jgi:hypothetical protein